MNIVTESTQQDKSESYTTKELEGCKLGRELGDCPLKRIGCGSLYDALMYITPPWSIRAYVKATMGDDPAAQRWLAHLDAVTPNVRPAAQTREWWR